MKIGLMWNWDDTYEHSGCKPLQKSLIWEKSPVYPVCGDFDPKKHLCFQFGGPNVMITTAVILRNSVNKQLCL